MNPIETITVHVRREDVNAAWDALNGPGPSQPFTLVKGVSVGTVARKIGGVGDEYGLEPIERLGEDGYKVTFKLKPPPAPPEQDLSIEGLF